VANEESARRLDLGQAMFWPPYVHNCDALRSNFVDTFTQLVVAEGIVSGQIPRLIRSIAFIVATLPVLGMGIVAPADTAHADDCLAAPNAPSPQGRHWYYRLDWATQRKCWYLRPPGRHVVSSRSISAADSAAMSVSSGDPDPASPNVKMLAVRPKIAPAITSIGDEPIQRDDTPAPGLESPAPKSTSSPTRDPAAAAPAVLVAWPDPPPVVATNNDAERSALSGEPNNNAKIPMMTIFPMLALGLAVAAMLSRFFKDRALVTINRLKLNRIDDQPQHEWCVDQDQNGPVDEKHTLLSALNDQGTLRSEAVSFPIVYEISKRRDRLARLHQNLDRLLQSPTPA
jgi:hypothetical protein